MSFLSYRVSRRVSDTLHDLHLSKDHTGLIISAILLANLEKPVIKDKLAHDSPAKICIRTKKINSDELVDVIEEDIDSIAIEEDKEFFKKLIDLVKNEAEQWTIDLVACDQIRPLKRKNIKSYFKMYDIEKIDGAKILEVIHQFRNDYPFIMKDEEYRKRLSSNQFIEEHTTFSATPKLCMRCIEELGEFSKCLISENDIQAVVKAFEAPYDWKLIEDIPKQVLALAYAYYEVNGEDHTNWRKGHDAIKNYPLSYTHFKNILQEHKKIKSFSNSESQLKELEQKVIKGF